jgi:hypothetical protein
MLSETKTTHGQTRTSEYYTWTNMKSRCSNENVESFQWYGARGIKVCEEWAESFEAFFEHVGRKPGPEYSIDRIDSDGDYEPGNVRWATWTEQARNKRKRK